MANKKAQKNIDILTRNNFWDGQFGDLGYLRTQYIEYLSSSLNSNVIKILTGQRRAGKSYILKQFAQYLIKEKKVDPIDILYINFELQDFNFIKNDNDLHELVKLYLREIKKNKKSKCYLFFDEIQDIEKWELVVNSFLADDTFTKEIFITGSNSKLISDELGTYLTGRFITKDVFPFSYTEYLGLLNLEKNSMTFQSFLEEAHVPETFHFNNFELKRNYMISLKDSILLKDVAIRYKVRNIDLIEKLFLFLADNISNPFSLNSLSRKLKAEGIDTNPATLGDYIKYFENVYLFTGADRYDIKGKQILEGEKKYYLNDTGFKRFLFSEYDLKNGKILENYAFNIFRKYGYVPYVGRVGDLEIDFVAEKYGEKIYAQVAYMITDEKVYAREFGNLEKIKDHWPKIVVSMDGFKSTSKNGIENIAAWDLEDWLEKRCKL